MNRLSYNLIFPNPVKKWICFSLIFLVFTCFTPLVQKTFCQQSLSAEKNKLKKQREVLLEQIALTESSLQKIAGKKSKLLDEINTLNSQVSAREKLLENYRKSIAVSKSQESALRDDLQDMQGEMGTLREEYAGLLHRSYKWEKSASPWILLLSSKSLNEALRRYVYFVQLEERRANAYSALKKTSEELEVKKAELHKEILSREAMSAEMLEEKAALEESSAQIELSLHEAESREEDLQAKFEEQKKARERLSEEIEELIRREERERAARSESESAENKREYTALSTSFSENLGNLPWPVANGFVYKRFGVQKHPSLPNIELENNGIEIAAKTGEVVSAIFNGTVIGSLEVPGYQNMIIISHGEYYSVYSRLNEVLVAKGQEIQTGTSLGYLSLDEQSGKALLHLEIWKGKEKLDPINCLRK